MTLIGYLLQLLGIIAGGSFILQRIFGHSLFLTFLTYFPVMLKGILPSGASKWDKSRILNDNIDSIYNSWIVILFYFVVVFITFLITGGFWIALLLAIFGVYCIPFWSFITWIAVLSILYFVTAGNLTAIKMKDLYMKDSEFTREKFLEMSLRHRKLTLVSFAQNFLINWALTPISSFLLTLTLLFMVAMHWPAWLIRMLPSRYHLDLANEKTRQSYYAGYSVLCLLIGTSLLLISHILQS